MRDLRIHLAYLTTGDLSRIGESLLADPDNLVPGWYVRASYDGYDDVVPYTRVDDETAMDAANALDIDLPGGGPIRAAVTALNAEAAAAKAKQIEHLRERIAADRAMLATLEGTTKREVER